MCGICCVLYCKKDSKNQVVFDKQLVNARGPDAQNEKDIKINDSQYLQLSGHVLHLRGELTPQPLEDDDRNCLLWNGEVFDGLMVKENENDTQVISERLNLCQTHQDILNVFDAIEGPWAFVYWQEREKRLWFGRDRFGRRSLLWHLPIDNADYFSISSVKIHLHAFSEIPAVGIFCLDFSKDIEVGNICLDLFPWNSCVWPDTQNLVSDDNSISNFSNSSLQININKTAFLKSGIPKLNKELSMDKTNPLPILEKLTHEEYLNQVLHNDELLKKASDQFLTVLETAVRKRVMNLPRAKINDLADQCGKLHLDVPNLCAENIIQENLKEQNGLKSKVAILFSGGIDSAVITALADRCIPEDESIDLLNVAFELQPKSLPNTVKHNKNIQQTTIKHRFNVPDRITGYKALSELNSNRQWNFIEINVTQEELVQIRSDHVRHLVSPSCTVLDDSIGCAVWFAARGKGILGNGVHKGKPFTSKAKVILCGMGADEQLAGYSRHRSRYSEGGWKCLLEEIDMEIQRISSRNLGRDDRIIGDHGKEARFPFLDEQVVEYLSNLPIHIKAQLDLPRGLGEKILFRLSAIQLGLMSTSCFPKRAIQFGSRIAKMENSKEKACEKCDRLTN